VNAVAVLITYTEKIVTNVASAARIQSGPDITIGGS
jgi:hypothetical protein